MQKTQIYLFKLCLSAIVLLLVFRYVSFEPFMEMCLNMDKSYVALCFGVFFLSHVVATLRWFFVLKSMDVDTFYKDVFLSATMGLFFNLMVPSFITGDVYRGYHLSKLHGKTRNITSSIFVSRLSGFVGLLCVCFVASMIMRNRVSMLSVDVCLLILLGMTSLGLFMIYNDTCVMWVRQFIPGASHMAHRILENYAYFKELSQRPRVFVKALGFSVVIQVLIPIGYYVAGHAFHQEFDLKYLLVITPIVTAISMLPMTISGFGTREATFVYFLSLVHVDQHIAVGIALLGSSFILFLGLLGGLLFFIRQWQII